jgi:hypothetical protein
MPSHDDPASSATSLNSGARAAQETRHAFASFKPSIDDELSLQEVTATQACIRVELLSRLPDIALTWWAARGLFQGAFVGQRFPALSQRAGIAAFLPALLMGIFQVTNTHRSLRCLIPTITSATPVGEALREVYAAHAPVGDPLSIAAARIASSHLGHGSLPAERLARKDALFEELAKVVAETVKPMKRDTEGERTVSSSTMPSSLNRRPSPSSKKTQGLDDLRAGTMNTTSEDEEDDDDRFALYPSSDDSWGSNTTNGDDSSGFSSSSQNDREFDNTEKSNSAKKGVRTLPPRDTMSVATSSVSSSSSSSDNNNNDAFHGMFGDGGDSSSTVRSDNNKRALGDEARWRERNRLPQKHEHEDIHPSYDIRRKRRESISDDRR